MIETLGLENVELRAMSILDVTEELGLFDYIICHGVYSWVPPAVQETILRVCRQNLARNGIAYVSYNTYPGWHVRDGARAMIVSHDDPSLPPKARIERAHAFIELIAQNAERFNPLHAEQLRAELAVLKGQRDTHFLHDQLEDYNTPVYFSEFMRRAGDQGLRFVAEARLGDLAISEGQWRGAISDPADTIRIQQYRDYATNRTFRSTLLCHDALAPRQEPDPTVAMTLRVSLRAERAPSAPDPSRNGSPAISFVTPGGGAVEARDHVSAAALHALDRVAPASLSFHELLQRTNDAVSVNEPPGTGKNPGRGLELATALLNAAFGNVVELTRHAPQVANVLSERPVASAVARAMRDDSGMVPDLVHRHVLVKAAERSIMDLLDGSNDRDAILERVTAFIADGTIVVEGEPLDRAGIEARVDRVLSRFARAALLER